MNHKQGILLTVLPGCIIRFVGLCLFTVSHATSLSSMVQALQGERKWRHAAFTLPVCSHLSKNYAVCKHFILSLLSCLFWLTGEMIILLGKLHPHSQSISCYQGKQTMSQLQQWALFWWLDMWSPKSVWHSDISLYKPAQHSLQYHLTVLWLCVAFDLFLFQCNIKPGLGN